MANLSNRVLLTVIMGNRHLLIPDDKTLHGHFSPDFTPVLTIDPGDSVQIQTLDAWWSKGPFEVGNVADRPKVAQHRDGYGHALIGPIEVSGAQPGEVLEVHIESIIPDTWGTSALPLKVLNERYSVRYPDVVHAWELDPVTMTGRNQYGHTVALRPFMGILGGNATS